MSDADDLASMLIRMQEGDPAFADNVIMLPAEEYDRFVGTLDDEPEPEEAPKLRALLRGPRPWRRS